MHRVSLFFIALAMAGTTTAQSSRIRLFIDSFVQKNNFNGTVLIQEKGKIRYQKSFGLANFQFKIPDKNSTKYKIASITKLFTAVLVMQLYEKGKLDLHKTIQTYLPDYKGEGGQQITIHQLLNHTSGLANMDTVKSMESALQHGIPVYQQPATTDQLLERYGSGPLVNEPGQVFDYNNADYIILGKIIERICQKPYDQVLKENILQPLHLLNTGLLQQQDIIPGLAATYFYRDDIKKLVPDLPVYIENWYAAGAMYSTANDLLQFSNALFGWKLIKKETLEMLLKPGLDDYGYGIWSYQTQINQKKYKVVKRPGQIMGSQTMLFHFLDEDITVILLSNTGTTNLDDFVFEISKRLVP